MLLCLGLLGPEWCLIQALSSAAPRASVHWAGKGAELAVPAVIVVKSRFTGYHANGNKEAGRDAVSFPVLP